MSSGTVLMIEPNPGILIVARNVLARAGFDVIAVAHANEAVQYAAHRSVDAVLMDAKFANTAILSAFARRRTGIPVILTVQKGRDVITLESIERQAPGHDIHIDDVLEKPFSPERLLATVEHAIERWNDSTQPIPADGLIPIQEFDEAYDPAAKTAAFPFADLLQRDSVSMEEYNDETKINKVLPPGIAARVQELRTFLAREGVKLDEAQLSACIKAYDQIAPHFSRDPRLGELAVHGRVERLPVDQILQMASTVDSPARCRLRRDGATIDIFYHGSHVVFARGANLPTGFTIGRVLVGLGRADSVAVEQTLAHGGRGWAGQRLIENGVINAEDLLGGLTRQTEELVYEAISWQRGDFSVYASSPMPEEASAARVEMPIHHLLLEGMRRLDEWARMSPEVGSLTTVLKRLEPKSPQILETLDPQDRQLLEAIDGRRTVAELVEDARRPTFDVFRALYFFAGQRLVRGRV